MCYQIRRVTGKWLDTINELQKVCLPSDKRSDVSVGRWWLVFHDGTPVAFAGWQPSTSWLHTAYLCRCGVIPSHRGSGLQKRLIRVRCSDARRQGCDWVITDTRQNPASANSLISCGFKMYTPSNPWGHSDACYWRKYIAG